MQFKIYAMVLLLMISIGSQAQIIFTGEVVDKNTDQPLPGVSIQEQGTKKGTVTGADGNFLITVSSEEARVKFSFIGYLSKVVQVKAAPATVALDESLLELNQVVVSSSGEAQARTEVPIAISKISTKALQETKPASLDQVMNKVSGVYMVDLRNEQHSIGFERIRGYNSIHIKNGYRQLEIRSPREFEKYEDD